MIFFRFLEQIRFRHLKKKKNCKNDFFSFFFFLFSQFKKKLDQKKGSCFNFSN